MRKLFVTALLCTAFYAIGFAQTEETVTPTEVSVDKTTDEAPALTIQPDTIPVPVENNTDGDQLQPDITPPPHDAETSPSVNIVPDSTDFVPSGDAIDYVIKRDYIVGPIIWDGVPNLDHNALKLLGGIREGDVIKVPGDDISEIINKLWDSQLFSDVQIYAEKIIDGTIFLRIKLEGLPKLSKFTYNSTVSKSEAEKLNDLLGLYHGKAVTQSLIMNTKNIVENYFKDKKYLNVVVTVTKDPDPDVSNHVILKINVEKGEKIKIEEIEFVGNEAFPDSKLRKRMKDTKERHWWNIFKTSKYLESTYTRDKESIIAFYNSKGYRDARIVTDSVYNNDEKTINIQLTIDEGSQYYFRNITWVGNTKYRSGQLDTILGIEYGQPYDQDILDQRLYMSPTGRDITSLYMDDGHLFFNITPVEVMVEGDSIDFEMRINEGKQARINKIIITGNTKTSEHVIRREIRTKPGDLFRRSDIIRTQRELSQLGYFDPEGFTINPIPNPIDGTVDIEYGVVERPSDQIELSGGFGAGRVVGTLGVTFNNFSLRKFFDKTAWRPLPSGDGQQLSIRAQSTGLWYTSYNLSFTEPWLGGKKPHRLTFSIYNTTQTNGVKKSDPERRDFNITGVSLGFGARMKFPDDWFQFYGSVNYQYYALNKYGSVFSFDDGYSNNASITLSLSRNSISDPLYPRWGSNITATVKSTLPWSKLPFSRLYGLEDEEIDGLNDQDKYRWIEYHKWKFTAVWYTPLSSDKKLVLQTRAGFGMLLPWSKGIGDSPFERFYLGGVPLGAFSFDGREIINLRGYEDYSLAPKSGATFISKFGLELRYPLSLNPSATIYGLAFAEVGNTWSDFKDYDPFSMNRSVGLGMRLFLPMFGWLGLDYGWGLDPVQGTLFEPGTGKFHFTIGTNLGEL